VFLPLAFSIMPLSIIVMMGATSAPAAPADSASTPMRSPSVDVFHSFLVVVPLSFVVIAELLSELEEAGNGNESLGFGIVVGIGIGIADVSAPPFTEFSCRKPSFTGSFKAPTFSSPIAASCDD
jgi:hypothetical protein